MALGIDRIIELYESTRAAPRPGQWVSDHHHALQCGWLAERDGAPPALVAAALLHDLGELLATQVPLRPHGADALHEVRALPFLRGRFGDEVVEPIRLHVMAKRFLAAREAGYVDTLVPASRESLRRQGGPLSPPEAERFLAECYAAQALQLRRWDDQAHSPTQVVPGWWYFRPLLVDLAGWQAELLAA